MLEKAPSLLCFAVVRSYSYEVDLVRRQCELNTGLFACDYSLLISNMSRRDLLGEAALCADTPVHVIEGTMDVQRGGCWKSSLNSHIFIAAWRAILGNGTLKLPQYDYVVKVDLDGIFRPEILRTALLSKLSTSGLRWFHGGKIKGPLMCLPSKSAQAFSRRINMCASSKFQRTPCGKCFNTEWLPCKDKRNGHTPSVTYADMGEDVWLVACMEKLGIKEDRKFKIGPLMHNLHKSQTPVSCKNLWQPMIHGLKSVDSFDRCWRDLHPAGPDADLQSGIVINLTVLESSLDVLEFDVHSMSCLAVFSFFVFLLICRRMAICRKAEL